MLSYSQIEYQKLILRSLTSKERNQKKTKHQRTERHDIKGVILKQRTDLLWQNNWDCQ